MESDFSSAFEKVQEMLSDENGQEQLQSILQTFLGGQSSPDNCTENTDTLLPSLPPDNSFSGDNSSGFNLDMFLKLQKIMSQMNNLKNNPQTDFLHSLKPFLKPQRRRKVEQAVKLINTIKAVKAFKSINEGGD